MGQPTIPSSEDLMLPCLRAVVQLGGQAPYREIDDLALDVGGVTAEQRAIEFDTSATATGPKVLQRLGWTRSMLKRIGALDSLGGGTWAVTDYGVELSKKPDAVASAEISHAVETAYAPAKPSGEEIEKWTDAAKSGNPEALATRSFVLMWGVHRRSTATVNRIRATLNGAGLITEPDFAQGSLDSTIRIVLSSSGSVDKPAEGDAASVPVGFDDVQPLVVGNIPSATGGIASVKPDDSLHFAQTVMRANDYSQLAVMGGQHAISGAVSWESIAKKKVYKPDAELTDCVELHPTIVHLGDPLLDAVPAISSAGYVFVRDEQNKVTGIITASDLADQFASLSRPFLLLGQIEQILRRAVNRGFSQDELQEAIDPDDDREVEGAESMTLGEIQRLVEAEDHFSRLGWLAARQVVIKHLDEVRRIRNEVMHFSPDPLEASDVRQLEVFHAFIAELDGQGEPG